MYRRATTVRHAIQLLMIFAPLMAVGRDCTAQPTTGADTKSDSVKDAAHEAFQKRDLDEDGFLTEQEFMAGGGKEIQVLRRDFLVFDADGNGRLSLKEFLMNPELFPEDQRGIIVDPVVLRSQNYLSDATMRWNEWDKNRDDSLDLNEFKAAGIGQRIGGLETMQFDDWDLNHDRRVSLQEVAKLLDIAFGVCVPTGESLRLKGGQVVHWLLFLDLQPDGNGRIRREDYVKAISAAPQKPEFFFPTINDPRNETFGFAEFATSIHRTDPVASLLGLDADLNGRLTPSELDALPGDWRHMARKSLLAFDDDGDGAFSLQEYQLLPHNNLLAHWETAQDANGDGKLSREEFQFLPMPALAALTAEYFRRLDLNKDQSLSLNEWSFKTTHPEATFWTLDLNSDGELTEDEFVAEGSMPANRLRRDFKVFDADSNGRMNRAEFLTIGYWVPVAYQTLIPDAVVLLSEGHMSELNKHWSEWDSDGDGFLSESEFKTVALGRRIRGLEMTGFRDWDLNQNRQISREEAAQLLDIAFGVRVPTGELLRLKAGKVVHWTMFQSLKPDRRGRARRVDYLKAISGQPQKPEFFFPTINDTGNETFGFAEFATSIHRTDPIGSMLGLDVDFNARLTPSELEALPDVWRQMAQKSLPGFDDDGDGAFSLREYQLLPHNNLLASWEAAQDLNHDGKLSQDEFHFMPMPALAALTAEYFRRLDTDKNGFLSVKEWVFVINAAKVPRDVILQQRDQDGDGRLTFDEVLGDLRQLRSGDRANPGHETLLLRIEEAFRRADVNDDSVLDRQELASDDGLEAIAPGTSGFSNKTKINAAAPITRFAGLNEASVETYAIIEFNILLVVAVGFYLYRKREKKE